MSGQSIVAGGVILTRPTAETLRGAKMPQGPLVGFQVPHVFYHNGQLSIYLRTAGVKPVFSVR